MGKRFVFEGRSRVRPWWRFGLGNRYAKGKSYGFEGLT